jgi:hypothetical protein
MDKDQVEALLNEQGRKPSSRMRIVDDTSDCMALNQGDVMVLSDTPYLITRNEKEAGFGQDNEPKFWVKRTINLRTGETKIVKLVFFEEFDTEVGGYKVHFYRSPLKEARVLSAVRDNPFFMHGDDVNDTGGNNVRIINFIKGPSLNKIVGSYNVSHEEFFHTKLLGILTGVSDCLQSLTYLHKNGLVHGDVRWDHVLFDRDQNNYRWIDFDYNYDFPASPFSMDLGGLGKIITYVVGMGGYFYSDVKANPKFKSVVDSLQLEDFSILEQNRLVNLKKIYPYIPDRLNEVLLHFSGHATVYYESVDEVLDDLRDALRDLGGVPSNN